MSQSASMPHSAIQAERLENDCYCCPYGGMHALPGILAGVAQFFTMVVSGSCNFLSITGSTTMTEELLNITTISSTSRTVGAGIFYFEDSNALDPDDSCVEYPDFFPTDTAFQFTRFFATLSMFGGLVLFVMLMIAACRDFSKSKYLMFVTAGFFALSLTCILQLVLLASDICTEASNCVMGGNAKLIIFTSLLWILAGVSTARLKRKPLEGPPGEMNQISAQSLNNLEDRSTAFTVTDLEDEVVGVRNSHHNLS